MRTTARSRLSALTICVAFLGASIFLTGIQGGRNRGVARHFERDFTNCFGNLSQCDPDFTNQFVVNIFVDGFLVPFPPTRVISLGDHGPKWIAHDNGTLAVPPNNGETTTQDQYNCICPKVDSPLATHIMTFRTSGDPDFGWYDVWFERLGFWWKWKFCKGNNSQPCTTGDGYNIESWQPASGNFRCDAGDCCGAEIRGAGAATVVDLWSFVGVQDCDERENWGAPDHTFTNDPVEEPPTSHKYVGFGMNGYWEYEHWRAGDAL